MIRKLVLFILVFGTLEIYAQLQGAILNPKYNKMLSGLLNHNVGQISCEELYLHQKEYILLDTREKEEFEISHIEGSRWVGYDKIQWDVINTLSKENKIVCYCSVGYRSEKVCNKLRERGFQEVYNLYGSIFEWANRNYPLVDRKGNLTLQVHAYNRLWGRWIDNKNILKKY